METLKTKIDKIINKAGPLRVPSYWMNHLLNDIVDKTVRTESEGSNQLVSANGQLIYPITKATSVVVDDATGKTLNELLLFAKGTTEERPSASDATAGFTYYDSTLGKMILSNGTS